MEFEIGKMYKTRGGWAAKVIWKSFSYTDGKKSSLLVIHKPLTKDESFPTSHNLDGTAYSILAINEAPKYDQSHPADLILI